MAKKEYTTKLEISCWFDRNVSCMANSKEEAEKIFLKNIEDGIYIDNQVWSARGDIIDTLSINDNWYFNDIEICEDLNIDEWE
tara:strand:- start:315 stop:563 length:249 start_codon:yes stop_codon:yes gene_type:complete